MDRQEVLKLTKEELITHYVELVDTRNHTIEVLLKENGKLKEEISELESAISRRDEINEMSEAIDKENERRLHDLVNLLLSSGITVPKEMMK